MISKFDNYLSNWLGFGFLLFIAAFFSGFDRDVVKQIGLISITLPVIIMLVLNVRRYSELLLCREFLLLAGFFLLLALADLVNLGAINWKISKYYLITLTFIIGAVIFSTQYKALQKYALIIPFAASIHALISWKMAYFEEGAGYLVDAVAHLNRLSGFGALYSPTASAFVYSAVFIFGCVFLLKNTRSYDRYFYVLLALLAICFSFVIATGTRSALLGLAAVLLVASIFVGNKKSIVVIVVGLFLCLLLLLLFSDNMNRGYSYRPELLSIGLDYVRASPLTGYGYIDNPYKLGGGLTYWQPHNEFVRIAEIAGTPALVVFIIAVAYIAIPAIGRARSRDWFHLAALLCVIFSLVTMLFTANKIIGKYNEAYIYFWMPLAFLIRAAVFDKKIAPTTPLKESV